MEFLLLDDQNARQAPTRDLVCKILARRFPLTIAEVHRELRTRFGLKISYQGVRKAINYLEEGTALERTAGKYALNPRWLLRTKSALDNLVARYQKGASSGATCESMSEQYSSFMLDSLLDLDNLWYHALQDLIEKSERNNQRSIVCFINYAWWMLINFGQETSLYEAFQAKGFSMEVHFLRSNPLNRWAAKIYRELGCEVSVKEAKNHADGIDLNILGNGVIQVEYPERVLVSVRTLFKRYRSLNDIPPAEVSRIAHRKLECRLIAFENEVVAKSLLGGYS